MNLITATNGKNKYKQMKILKIRHTPLFFEILCMYKRNSQIESETSKTFLLIRQVMVTRIYVSANRKEERSCFSSKCRVFLLITISTISILTCRLQKSIFKTNRCVLFTTTTNYYFILSFSTMNGLFCIPS